MPARSRRRETPAEARTRRAAIDDPDVVLAAVARLLESRQRSVAEVRRRLLVAGYDPSLVEGAVERMVALGYLDDAAFARAWIESRDRAHPRGARALRAELRRMGLGPEVVEDALGAREAVSRGEEPADGGATGGGFGRATSTASDLEAAARLLGRRQAALLRETDPQRRRAKAYGLLARNGFDPDTCREVVATWLESAAAGESDPP